MFYILFLIFKRFRQYVLSRQNGSAWSSNVIRPATQSSYAPESTRLKCVNPFASKRGIFREPRLSAITKRGLFRERRLSAITERGIIRKPATVCYHRARSNPRACDCFLLPVAKYSSVATNTTTIDSFSQKIRLFIIFNVICT